MHHMVTWGHMGSHTIDSVISAKQIGQSDRLYCWARGTPHSSPNARMRLKIACLETAEQHRSMRRRQLTDPALLCVQSNYCNLAAIYFQQLPGL